ncbi:MoeA N-terminal region (Domain I and II) protein [groundwater metagenome]|uniref:molybdopterin molybdotransferase n=1 Tax=groundwater metagenome TaxID=717931 RepID=A0A098E8J2_9ZZZZ
MQKKNISLDEAKKIIDANIAPIQRTEILKIKDLIKFNVFADRVLATDVISGINVPPFDKSAMDGYAVKFEDTQNASSENPVKLKLSGSVFAGQTGKNKTTLKEIKSGECIYVTTGSVLPVNANAVVMIENTKREGNKVKIFKSPKLSENIGKEGEDIKKGNVLLRKGEILTPAKIGVLTAIGVKETEVYSIPNVAIIGTGNEIIDVGKKLTPGKIYDINSYALAAVIKKAGCIPVRPKIAKDEEKILQKRLEEALQYDVVVISGGSSVGEKDLLSKVVESSGKILFHGVNIKPGKPTLFGNVNGKPVFGMPGNPASCLMNACVFLLPALRKMARISFERKIVKAKISEKLRSNSDRHLFVTVKLENGCVKAVYKTSGAITSMSGADGFIEIPITKQVIEKEEEVEVNLF